MHIIPSLLFTDLYKLTMQQCVLHQFPSAQAKFRFKCRNEGVDLLPLKDQIIDQVEKLSFLRFKEDELNYLSKIRFMKPDFIEFLRIFKLNKNHVKVGEVNGKLDITIEGPWLYTILYEIYLLAIVHELYNMNKYTHAEVAYHYEEGKKNLQTKIDQINDFNFRYGYRPLMFDFGTRRAYNHYWLDYVVKTLFENKAISGTSNVYLAMKYGITPIGTFAHEFVQVFQGLGTCSVKDSQKMAMQAWANEYRGDLGIALSDTLGFSKFLKDFDMYFAKLFDGIRVDSGDPFEIGERMIKHYNIMKIDPKTKMILFSDGLDIQKVFELEKHFNGKIRVSFGVGTNLTNDCGVPALQNVIKMVELNGNPVAKLSDSPGKEMCENIGYLTYLRSVI